ncbi:MAG: hypothetical protein LBQ82_00305, partial [Treponema sp.]|nr:hypothetical protein [Treponema sp.]
MRKVKALAIIALVAVIGFSFTACGDGDDNGGGSGGGGITGGGLDRSWTWTSVANSPFTKTINAVAYGNNKFVAGGNGGTMAYSDDNGVTW